MVLGGFTLVAALLLPVSISAQSLCVPSGALAKRGTPAYQFAGALIDSLAYARAGADRAQSASRAFERGSMTTRSLPELVVTTSTLMYELRASDSEYRCAARLVKPSSLSVSAGTRRPGLQQRLRTTSTRLWST